MKKFLRTLHRWLGLLMALQLLAWFGSGLYFALSPIETIRGTHLVEEPAVLHAAGLEGLISPSVAWVQVAADTGAESELTTVSLTAHDGHTWYRVSGTSADAEFVRLVDGLTGAVAPRIDEREARRIAEGSLAVPGTVSTVELVTESPAGSEYRDHRLPLWRVGFDDPESLNLYIDPWTREIAIKRTARWRIFDFLWMLHIMDWSTRDDFNTPLLQIAAAVGLIIVLSGLIYWFMTSKAVRRLRPGARPRGR